MSNIYQSEEALLRFKTNAVRIVTIDEELKEIKKTIKPAQDLMKELKKERKELEEKLAETMKSSDLGEAKITSQNEDEKSEPKKLVHKETEKLEPVKMSEVRNKLITFFKEGPGSQKDKFSVMSVEEKGDIIHNYIYVQRGKTTVSSVKSKPLTKKELAALTQ